MTVSHADQWALLLLAYAEGELPAQERSQVAAHLARCPSCQADLFALRATLGLPDPVEPGPAPSSEAFLAAVLKRGEPALPPKRRCVPSRQQLTPVTWFFCALPTFFAFQAPTPKRVGFAFALLAVGYLLDYALQEVYPSDPDRALN